MHEWLARQLDFVLPWNGLVLVLLAAGCLKLSQTALRRKKAEDALRDSEGKHRVLCESSPDAIMTIAPPDWRFTDVNPAAIEFLGAKHEEACSAR